MDVPPPGSANQALSRFFGPETLRRLELPTGEATALPNPAYTSPEFLKLENERLFARTWMLAGLAHEIPMPGDAMPVTVADRPVILVRDQAGTVRAFHNVCRHRGAQLLLEPCRRLRAFTCPNHAWSYDLSGKLRMRPHFYGGDKHEIVDGNGHLADLEPVRCETWFDWIFVNMDGNAAPLGDYLKPMVDRLQGYDFAAIRHGETLEYDLKANWKLPLENFIEPYHVFACHPWLSSFVPMNKRTPPDYERHCLFCGYHYDAPDPARGMGLPYFTNLPPTRQLEGIWFLMFPGFCFQVFPDQVVLFLVTPQGPERTLERIVIYFIGDEALKPDYAEARQRVIDNWVELNAEDIGIIERMQLGRHSDGFDGGVLSPYWDRATHQFARLLVDAMRA
ncbi:MAG: aromatic ring-hydroxylating dioxygenase subunit alpha [Alphaproteobacteria bacterium]